MKGATMKPKTSISLAIVLAAGFFSTAWAGEPADPTPLTNKAAIELVQAHANYLWTLVAACLVFFMQAGSQWWRPDLPGRKTPSTL